MANEHTGHGLTCATRHTGTDPTVANAIKNGGATCATGRSPLPDHNALPDTTVTAACTGSECHTGTSLIPIHINTGPTLDWSSRHTRSNPKVIAAIAGHDKSCTACGDALSPHSDQAAKHASSGGSDFVSVGMNEGDHSLGNGVVASCSDCQVTNLTTLHSSDCTKWLHLT